MRFGLNIGHNHAPCLAISRLKRSCKTEAWNVLTPLFRNTPHVDHLMYAVYGDIDWCVIENVDNDATFDQFFAHFFFVLYGSNITQCVPSVRNMNRRLGG